MSDTVVRPTEPHLILRVFDIYAFLTVRLIAGLAIVCGYAIGVFRAIFERGFPSKSSENMAAATSKTVDLAKISANLVKNAVTGEMVRLDSFWKDQSCVLHFMRRFGWAFCRLGAKDISTIHPQLKAHDVRLVGIGLEQLGVEDFMQGNFFSGEIYIDEKKKSYEDLGYKRFSLFSVLRSLVTRVAMAATKRAKAEKVGGNLAGDGLQNGGTLVIKKGGEVLLNYRQENPADHVEPKDILKALNIPEAAENAPTASS